MNRQENMAEVRSKRFGIAAGIAGLLLVGRIENAAAVEFMPLGKALQGMLGTPKVFKKNVDHGKGVTSVVFYSKDPSGKPAKIAVVEKGLYPPDCTHTWAIGLDPVKGSVTQIQVVEMKCPHAFPCRANSFLDQFKGKGPADVAKLKGSINTIAKATGTSDLTTDAVKRAVTALQRIKTQL